jgi:hypothetical protein
VRLPPSWHSRGGQSLQDEVHPLAQVAGSVRVLPREPLEQTEAPGRVQQAREVGMAGICDHGRPARQRLGTGGGHMNDRAVQQLQCGLERRRDAGAGERCIDRRDIDCNRAGLTHRPP